MKILKKCSINKKFILILMSVGMAALTALTQIPVIIPTYVDDIPVQERIVNMEAVRISNLMQESRETSVTDAPPVPVSDRIVNMEAVKVSNLTQESREASVADAPMPEIIPSGIIYPKPTNVPSLKKYEINKDSDHKIWGAQNPESYIVPRDEWVRYMASRLYIDHIGRIRYKNTPIPLLVGLKGNVILWTSESFLNNYVSDDKLFNFPADSDLWQNADYYLSHGMRGDCEDWSISITSMMLSGEMSILENGSYIRQVIPAKVVMGLSGETRDAWTEYSVYGNRYISSTGTEFDWGSGKDVSFTTFHPENEWEMFKPLYQFTNKYFGKYKDDIK